MPTHKNPIRIVVADDHLSVRVGIRHLLEAASDIVIVGEASDGIQALSLAEGLLPDILLLDVEMPGMDGFAFIRQARAHPKLKDVPSMLVTSRTSQEDRLRGQEVGALAYMAKGEFDQDYLLETVRRWVG